MWHPPSPRSCLWTVVPHSRNALSRQLNGEWPNANDNRHAASTVCCKPTWCELRWTLHGRWAPGGRHAQECRCGLCRSGRQAEGPGRRQTTTEYRACDSSSSYLGSVPGRPSSGIVKIEPRTLREAIGPMESVSQQTTEWRQQRRRRGGVLSQRFVQFAGSLLRYARAGVSSGMSRVGVWCAGVRPWSAARMFCQSLELLLRILLLGFSWMWMDLLEARGLSGTSFPTKAAVSKPILLLCITSWWQWWTRY